MAAEETTVDLADLTRGGPWLVAKLPHEPGGVDFLGLRQVNLDLMQQLLPTVNNVVSHVRIYSVLAWAWWKAEELSRQQGQSDTAEIKRFVERVEILFTWSHLLNGNTAGLPGNTKKPPSSSGKVALDLKSWKRSPYTAALMAPVQYGPSLRYPYGFRYVLPVPDFPSVLTPLKTVMSAVRHLDGKITKADRRSLLATLKNVQASAEDVKPLYEAWRFDVCDKVEREVFLNHFSDPSWRTSPVNENDARWRRSRTIAFFMDVLRQAPSPLSVADFRLAATSGRFECGKRWKSTADVTPAAATYLLLQARQGQRQALEILFSWVESRLIHRPGQSPRELAKQAARDFEEAAGNLSGARSLAQIAQILRQAAKEERDLPEALGANAELDLFGLMAESVEIAGSGGTLQHLLATATNLLVLSGLLAATQKDNPSMRAQFELSLNRVPMKTLIQLLDDHSPLEDAYHRILAEMVIGQHMSWAVARNTDETQRLRISLEEEGLVPLSARPLVPAPTPDRLDNLFELLTEAGIWEAICDEEGVRYLVA
jgi:hypothetical protein